MSEPRYLEERAPAAGSSAHYALRMAPQRMQALALYVLLRELRSILDISDDNVAHAKLAWWRLELARLAPAGRSTPDPAGPSHPLTQALAQLGFGTPAGAALLLRIADAIEIDLTQSRFLDDVALERYLALAAGAPAAALALAAGLPEAVQAHAALLGEALGRARLLMDAGRYARQKRIYLPHQLLKQFDVPAADILNAHVTPAVALLAAFEADTVRQQVAAALARLSKEEKRRLRALVVYAALTLARLDEVARDGFRITLHRVSLTPLRKLFIAWRCGYFTS